MSDIFDKITIINDWLDESNYQSGHEDAMRVMKVGEKYGEAVAAYIGMTGQNPRKGVTHLKADLLQELADVAITAIAAIQHFTGDAIETEHIIRAKIRFIIDRANLNDLG